METAPVGTTAAVGLAAEALFAPADGWTRRLFAPAEPAWTALARLDDLLVELTGGCGTPHLPDGVFAAGDVLLGTGVTLEPGCYLRGPAVIGDGATVRHGAYLRGGTWVGEGCIVGHASELKHAILLPGAHAPHFNYVGDSILGHLVNLGAGTILSNVPLAGGTVHLKVGAESVDTGLRKLGALLGDGSQTGCNTVLNPGTVAGRGCWFYPLSNAVGYFPAGSRVRTHAVRWVGGESEHVA